MQSTLQSHPGHNQPSSSGGTVSTGEAVEKEKWILKQFETHYTNLLLSSRQWRELLSSFNKGGCKQY